MECQNTLQDLVQCFLCETPTPPMYCDICEIYLCKSCVGEHLSDDSMTHKVVTRKMRGSTSKCQKHSFKICELHCKQCNIPICALCISSGEHEQHQKNDISESCEKLKKILMTDIEEMEKCICPKYRDIVSNISVEKTFLNENSRKIAEALHEKGEELHSVINSIVEELISDLDRMESRYLAILNNQEEQVNDMISEIKQIIDEMKDLLYCNDIHLFSSYKSRNHKFRKLPPKLTLSIPRFTNPEINKKNMLQLFGSLSKFSIKREEGGYVTDCPVVDHFPIDIIKEIDTSYGDPISLCSVSCLNDEELWLCGWNNVITLYNLQGKLVKSVQTKSKNIPWDVAVTRLGELVYTDHNDRTVNIVNKKTINEVIRLKGWTPLSVCSTQIGDLLVFMTSDDYKQGKIVRFSGAAEKQTIQVNDDGQPLYSTTLSIKYVCENRNLDICVSDSLKSAVVVVNTAGKYLFTYTGLHSYSVQPFQPRGITTDSQCQILIADYGNHCVHIVDQDGQFVSTIDNCKLYNPWGLCVDTRDNLFVTEYNTGKLKRIHYY